MTRSSSALARFLQTMRESGPLWALSLVADRVVPFGVLGLWSDTRVSAETLEQQVAAILRAWGAPDEHAAITARNLLYADLHGIDSHGCSMLRHYHRELEAGLLEMSPIIAVTHESETTALIDGGGGLGHVPGRIAMELAISKCRQMGVAAVAVRNSGHYGAAGAYAAMAADAGMIGVATTNTRVPSVVPTFAAEAKLGTNPIAFAAPAARNAPFLLDMATSTASLGQLMTAWRKGRGIPTGWALAQGGSADTNARRAAQNRRLTPLGSSREMGSHKGYGLGVAVEILSSVLPGMSAGGGGVGHFFLALDPRRFCDDGSFQVGLDALLDSLRASTPLRASEPVLVAGDPERAAFDERSRTGIPLSRSVVEDIRSIALASGAPFLLEDGGRSAARVSAP